MIGFSRSFAVECGTVRKSAETHGDTTKNRAIGLVLKNALLLHHHHLFDLLDRSN